MNKGLILTLALVVAGGLAWLLARDDARTAERDAPTRAADATATPGSSSSSLQAPPADPAQAQRDAAAAASDDPSRSAADVIRGSTAPTAQPPQFVQGVVTASLGDSQNLETTFADRYAKVDTAGRIAKLDELTQLLEQHQQGTLPADRKFDESRIPEMEAEIAWLTANPGG
jgi:hypothetical protein